MITDNILIACESIHAIKKKKREKRTAGKGKKGKREHQAYDRVEWGFFLEKIMLKLGFDARWVKLIMECVTLVRYNVRFNSRETEIFLPTRGLHQGDPLSPYLFLMIAEGLSCLLKGAENRGELEGIRVCRDAPMLLALRSRELRLRRL
jgi:hypothetical protein